MRIPPLYTLLAILVLTAVAVWVDLPGSTLDPLGLKDDVYVHEGLDLQGGLQVLLEADPPDGQSVDSDTLDGTRNTIERRVNELGVSEPLIQTRGDNQIIVELPGLDNVPDCLEDEEVDDCEPEEIQELPDGNADGTPDCLDDGDSDDCTVEGIGAANAVSVLQETALLEFIDPQGQFLADGTVVTTTLGGREDIVADTASPGATPGDVPPSTPVVDPALDAANTPTGPIYNTIVTGADVDDAYLSQDPTTRQYVVAFEIGGSGSDALCDFTNDNIGLPMTIVLDKEVISSATIQAAICGSGQISGMALQEVQDLVVQLKAGSLAVPLVVMSSRLVGPSLGQESIDKSLVAGVVGLAAVALFMIAYYRLPGVLSVLALLIYTALTFALFKLIPVTLTLAGIAGFILSIGMAVDANILIFSRLREELRTGRGLISSVEAGFDHAWPSIRDSNIATMISSGILYWFGNYTGATIITGFALTLFIGVVVSMFTAITVSRTLLRLAVRSRAADNLWLFGVERGELQALGSVTAD